MIVSLITSILIEATQYIFNLGWCEIDDVISNTAGAMIGFAIAVVLKRICDKRKEKNLG